MLFRQVLHEDLGCASYLVADGGEAAVVDPQWEIEPYLALARTHGLRIAHVLETHTHADHVSGRGRLIEATGAALAHGDVSLGDTTIRRLPTPGHRPEHVAYTVSDGSRGSAPWLVLTGDSLFVGDVARPDLAVEPEEGARELFHSLRRLLELDDGVEVWPGHIGGSLCGGGGMSEKPGSTIGFERRFNRYLQLAGEDEFVRTLLDELAPQPPNFERIVDLNRGGPPSRTAPLDALAPERVRALLDEGAVLVDGREPSEFDALHVPGSLSVTTKTTGVGTRAAWVLEPDGDVVVLAAGDADAGRLAGLLEAVAFRRIRGFVAGGIAAWQAAGLPTESLPALDVAGLAERLRRDEVLLLDVREDDEWQEGHVEGSLHIPYHELTRRLPPDGKPLAVACSAGNRSSLAASLLRREGVEDVVHVADGGVADLADEGIRLVASNS